MKNRFSGIFTHLKHFALAHKVISTIIVLCIIFIGYKGIQSYRSGSGETRYIIAAAERGTIVSTVTGTGQIASSNQVDLKSKASGTISEIHVSNGQEVKAGTLLTSVDARDAQIALESARLSYQKLTQKADLPTLIQAQNALASAEQASTKAADDLKKAYDNGFASVSSTFIDLPDIMSGLTNLFTGTQGNGILTPDRMRSFGTAGMLLRDKAESSYFFAKQQYDRALTIYKSVSQKSTVDEIASMVDVTYGATKSITEATKDAKAAVDFMKDQGGNSSEITTNESNLSTWTSKLTSHLDELSSITNTIKTSNSTITSSQGDIAQKRAALNKLVNGADPLDIQSEALSLRQKEYAYQDSFIVAPFDGIVAKISVKQGDTVSSGTSVGTFITKQQVANISLNEVDVSKVALGQKVTLTLDAIEDLTLTGKVTDIDLVGTVTQGVVVYNVQITLDTTDARIKPGMSVSAAIATQVDQDVIIVPNSALKTQGTMHYVEVVPSQTAVTTGNTGVVLPEAPTQVEVEVGIADDLSTEITSGLNEGDKIVTRTITSSTKTTTSAPSIFNAAGVRGGAGGGNVRRIGG